MLAALPKAERGATILCNNVATMLKDQGRLAEAEVLQREQLAADRAESGDRDPNTLTSLGNLATNLRDQGKLAEAEPLFREALAAERERLRRKRLQRQRDRQGMNMNC